MAIDWDKLETHHGESVKRMFGPTEKPSKYRNKKREYKGVLYDSIAEADYAAELDAQKLAGDIAWVLRQVWIPLGDDFRTRIDFQVAVSSRPDSNEWVRVHGAEVKGAETKEFKRVRRLWPKYGPFPLFVVKNGKSELIEGKP